MSNIIYQVVRHDGAWAVEHEGRYSNRTPEKAIAIASANRMARAALGAGRLVQVRIEGESGYF